MSCPCRCALRRGIATPADAALMMQPGAEVATPKPARASSSLEDPERRAKAIVEATDDRGDLERAAQASMWRSGTPMLGGDRGPRTPRAWQTQPGLEP